MVEDPYCYPGSEVLRNRLNIRDQEILKATEARIASVALFLFQDQPFPGPWDEHRLKETHRAVFGSLYEWAGTYRANTGTMTKVRATGHAVTYAHSRFIPGEMKRVFRELAAERYLHGLEPGPFAARLVYFYSEMDATHPFREGNSRTLRQFFTDLAKSAGYELDWGSTGVTEASRNALYLARDLACTQRNYAPLLEIVRSNLRPLQP